MITNETRAKLIHPDYRVGIILGAHGEADRRVLTNQPDGPHRLDMGTIKSFAYDTDANAVAELRAFVRARGKMREFCGHILQIVAPALNIGAFPIERIFDLLDATPAQQTAAFDTVFKPELERINET